MRRTLRILSAPFIALMALIMFATAASATVYTSTDRWGSWSDGTYTVYNDGWGSNFDYQYLWVNSASNWGVDSLQPATSGVEAYPNVSRTFNKSISSLKSVSSSFNITDPGTGAYESAYDIWTEDNAYEIMAWTHITGNVGPLGTSQGTVTLGSRSWTVYKGSNGSNVVISFVANSQFKSGTVNILALLTWIQSTKGWMSNETLGKVQFGWEITTESSTKAFTVNSYSASAS